MMRDHDDEVTGGAIIAVHECVCGTPVVVSLAGGARCHGCGRRHAMADPDDPTDEAVALGEMPGGSRRKPTWGDE